jgi:Double zinc ribbon
MYCPNCGVLNPDGAETCRICGKGLVEAPPTSSKPSTRKRKKVADEGTALAKELRDELGIETEEAPSKAPPEEPSPAEVSSMYPEPLFEEPSKIVMDKCPICGRPKDESANLCDYCLESEQQESQPQQTGAGSDTGYIDTREAEELDLAKLGGIAVIISGFLGVIYGIATLLHVSISGLPVSVVCFSGLMPLFGVAAIVGGYFALEHENAIYAIIGAVCGILSVGYYIGAFIAFIGLVLFIKSYNEFEVREVSLKLSK